MKHELVYIVKQLYLYKHAMVVKDFARIGSACFLSYFWPIIAW